VFRRGRRIGRRWLPGLALQRFAGVFEVLVRQRHRHHSRFKFPSSCILRNHEGTCSLTMRHESIAADHASACAPQRRA